MSPSSLPSRDPCPKRSRCWRRWRKTLVGRHRADADDEGRRAAAHAPGQPEASSAWTRSRPTASCASAPWPRCARLERSGRGQERLAGRSRAPCARSPTCGCATSPPSAARSRTPIRTWTCRRCLSALGARATIAGPGGERTRAGRGAVRRLPREHAQAQRAHHPRRRCRRWASVGAAYLKCTTRSADDWPAVGIAVGDRRRRRAHRASAPRPTSPRA